MKPTFLKGAAVGAATCFVMLAVTSALAGSGIGDVFNLGQTNSVDATSALQGTVDGGAQLAVTNSGAGAAVRGDSAAGRGLVGNHTNTSGNNPGIEASTSSLDNAAAAILGRVPAGSGLDSSAVRGINPSAQAGRYGVWGSANGSGFGVFGQAKGGSGVSGDATTGTGVLGTSDTGIALRGLSQSGRGVQGQNLSSTRSINGDQSGVFGTASGDDGGQFVSGTGTGVCAGSGVPCGNAGNEGVGVGVYAASTNGNAISGTSASAPPLALSGPASVPPMTLNSSARVDNLNADRLDGLDSKQLVTRGRVYYRQSALSAGTKPGGGACTTGATCYIQTGCDSSSDLLLSGGYWGIEPGTTVFSSRPLNVDQWQVGVTNDSSVDTFFVSVWCADLTP